MESLEKWHQAVRTRDVKILDEILAEDVIFYSPVVWTPQEGKEITKMYLTAAMFVIGNDDFKYEKEVVANNQACLEFTTKIGDITINGIDIITLNDEGKIIEFKVMVRPLKAIMTLKDKMFRYVY